MALIRCEECGKEISDTALACPNCGYQQILAVFSLIPMKLNIWPCENYISDGYYIFSNLIKDKR